MNLYLIRHGQSYWQLDPCYGKDSNLTDLGEIQSKYLNKYILKLIHKDLESWIIYASPLKRAIQTVQSLKKDYILKEEICEACFHISPNLPQFSHPFIYKKKLSNEARYQSFRNSLELILNKIILEKKHKTFYFYTHGGVIKTILRILHDNDSICYTINNCSITQITWKNSRWHVERLNEISFLPRKYIT